MLAVTSPQESLVRTPRKTCKPIPTAEMTARPASRPTPAPAPQIAYRIDQAAAAIGIGRTKLYALIASGRLEARRVDGITIIRHVDLVALVDDAPRIEPSPDTVIAR